MMHGLDRLDFGLGRAALGRGRLDLGPGKAVLVLDRLDLGADGREEGFPVREGAVMTRMRLGKGFQPNMGLGNENFQPSAQYGTGSSGFVETGVDSGGWRPPMVRNWVGQTQFGVDSRVRKLKMPIFEGEDAYGWVYRVERYFTINGLSEREKLMRQHYVWREWPLSGFNSVNNDNH